MELRGPQCPWNRGRASRLTIIGKAAAFSLSSAERGPVMANALEAAPQPPRLCRAFPVPVIGCMSAFLPFYHRMWVPNVGVGRSLVQRTVSDPAIKNPGKLSSLAAAASEHTFHRSKDESGPSRIAPRPWLRTPSFRQQLSPWIQPALQWRVCRCSRPLIRASS